MLAKRAKLYFTISCVVLVVAILLATWGFPQIVKKQIQKNVAIANTSKMFERWVKLPMPLEFKIYVFNVTNAEEVNDGAKPVLQEIGPYVYKQYRERRIIGYGHNDTIFYMLKKTFYFDEEASKGVSQDDEVTVIYYPYIASVLTIYAMSPSLLPGLHSSLEQFFPNLNDPFLRVKVRDLFFDGIFLDCSKNLSMLKLICDKVRSQPSPTMRPSDDDTGFYFSMFSHLNRTESGPYEMNRGTEDVAELGHIVSYKNETMLHKWGADRYCNMINGSDGTVFPPIDESNVPQKLYSFEPEICRSMFIELVGKTKKFNMDAYKYEMTSAAMAAKSANPNNKCFCEKNWSVKHDGCLIMGVQNLLACHDAPAIVSLPHFYLASEELLDYVIGLSPNETKHGTFAYLDPVTGVVLDGKKRLQFNIELRQVAAVAQLANVPTGLFPLLWLEEGATLPESLQEELMDSHKLLGYVEIVRWAILVLAIVAALLCGLVLAKSNSLPIWPKNSNNVTFILQPGANSAADNTKMR